MSETTSGAAATPERRPSRQRETGRDTRRDTRQDTRKAEGNVFERLGLWYRQIAAELRKVIWPTRKELVAYTTVTLVFAVVVILIVAGLDYGANWVVLRVFG